MSRFFKLLLATTALAVLGTGAVPAGASSAPPVVNGSFEEGFTGWQVQQHPCPHAPWQVLPANHRGFFGFARTQPEDGAQVATNGFDGCPGRFAISQTITLPAGGWALGWDDRFQWNMLNYGALSTKARTAHVEVLDPSTGQVLATLASFSTGVNTKGDSGWTRHEAELTGLGGRTVTIRFRQDIPQSFTGPGQYELDRVVIVAAGDAVAPTVEVPDGVTAEATGADGAAVEYEVTATDDVDDDPAVECSPASGSTFAIGDTTVDCSATDAAGNIGTASFEVTVQDTTAPVISFSGNAATYGVDEHVAIGCVAADAVSPVSCDGVSGAAHSFGIGETVVTASATDAAGNEGTGTTSFTVEVTVDGLSRLTSQLVAHKGIANSLEVKLSAGSDKAYRNELKAQAGKKVSAADAALLTQLSLALG